MVMRVTGYRLRAAGGFPRSHVVGKAPGDIVRITWNIINTGGPTLAHLMLMVAGVAPGGTLQGTNFVVQAGTPDAPDITALLLPYPVPAGVAPGTYRATVEMWESDAVGTHLGPRIGRHDFDLVVSGVDGGLVAVGEPIIV
jgi:hypothetical protein